MSENKFYLTTPIYYVNARPHIGHAYTTIVADVLARRHRLLGEDTFFLTGTDEHGQKIERSAAAAGIPPQQFADQVSKSFEDLWKRMGITNDDYIRTTSDKHKRGVQKLFAELYARGFIYLASYTGSYCVSDEAFVDAPVGTPCPDCGRLLEEVTEENFFFKLSAFQQPLIDLIESNTIAITPESRKNEVLSFVKGNVSAASLLDAVILSEARSAESKDPEGAGTTTASGIFSTLNIQHTAAGTPYVPGALKDLSISRSSFTWGIPVPEPAASTAAQKHVIYVWLDALANYMTAIGYGSDDPAEQAKFKNYWPADLHLVGKEIIRFHCVYWPAFLLALNPEGAQTPTTQTSTTQTSITQTPITQTPGAPGPASGTRVSREAQGPQLTFDQHKAWAEKWLPKAITAHGWLLFEDSKMSKSKGNIVRTETILDAFGTLCPPSTALKGTGFSPSVTTTAKDAALAAEGISSEPTNRRGTASAVPESPSTEDGASAPEVRLASQAECDLFASDVLRYFLLREIPFGQDGSFSFDALITRYNADLANGYGNLVSRVLTMINKYLDGEAPPFAETVFDMMITIDLDGNNNLEVITAGKGKIASDIERTLPSDQARTANLQKALISRKDSIDAAAWYFERLRPDRAIGAIYMLIDAVDKYLSDHAPWKLAKSDTPEDRTKLSDMMYSAAESIRIITALLYPILPYATAKVWAQLGLGDIEAAARNGELKNLEWGGLKPGTKLGPLGPIFPRADKGLAQIMTDMETPTPTNTPTTDPAAAPRTTTLAEPATALPVGGSTALTTGPTPEQLLTTTHQPPTTDYITIDDFAKIELRVAQILIAERIPKADKLLRLEVDLGPDFPHRQILSGIAEWYTPEDLIGRRIVVITNLAPRKMRGLESHGMLLAASHGENGKPVLATFGEDIALGARLK